MAQRNKKSGKDLTRMEKEVLDKLKCGMFNKEIADFYKLSINTIRAHVHNILIKLGVNNRTEAIVEYMKMTGEMQ